MRSGEVDPGVGGPQGVDRRAVGKGEGEGVGCLVEAFGVENGITGEIAQGVRCSCEGIEGGDVEVREDLEEDLGGEGVEGTAVLRRHGG